MVSAAKKAPKKAAKSRSKAKAKSATSAAQARKKSTKKIPARSAAKAVVGKSRKAKKTAPSVQAPTPVVRRRRKWEVTARDWARYQKFGTEEMRQKLLNQYVPLVRNVATRMAMGFPRSVELTDLINTGAIGLIEAFANYDPERGVKFETYAVPRIRGAILDELRSLDWVPRSTRAKGREIDKAVTSLENELGRQPGVPELARHMKLTLEELNKSLDDVSSTAILSLDEVIYPDDDNRQVPRIETVEDSSCHTILGGIEKGEMRSFLVVAMDRLTAQEKLVIALYYFEELTLKEIGEVMSISESRVSQIHTRAVMKLRNMVKEKFAMTG
jgi:RNA polymerase sigma factor for flagellar operon FliA